MIVRSGQIHGEDQWMKDPSSAWAGQEAEPLMTYVITERIPMPDTHGQRQPALTPQPGRPADQRFTGRPVRNQRTQNRPI
jgi:hypothetical protein